MAEKVVEKVSGLTLISDDGHSFTSSSYFSSSGTATSGSTLRGPGALTGKALRAFGLLTIRGIEDIAIRRKMSAIQTRFRHRDSATVLEETDPLYDDLLELSRPGMYSTSIRLQALRLLLTHISLGFTANLVKSLLKWPLVEIQLFLREIMACLPEIWIEGKRDEIHVALKNVYIFSARKQSHSATAYVNFITEISEKHLESSQAAIGAGVLDMLLNMCISDFSDPTPFDKSSTSLRENRSALLTDCTKALAALASHRVNWHAMAEHPLHIVWPRDHWQELAALQFIPLTAYHLPHLRRDVWVGLGRSRIIQRLVAIEGILDRVGFHAGMTPVYDACLDLIELSRSGSYESDITERALTALLHCIALGGDVWKVLRSVLLSSTSEDVLRVFTRMIGSVSSVGSRSASKPQSCLLYEAAISRNKDVHPIDYFLEFVTTVAQPSRAIGRALLDAGILSLLFMVVKDVIDDPFKTIAPMEDSTVWSLLQTESLRFYDTVQKNGFINPWTDDADQNRMFAHILAMLLCLLKDGDTREPWMDSLAAEANDTVTMALHDAEILASLCKPAYGKRISDVWEGSDGHNRLLICYQTLAVLFGSIDYNGDDDSETAVDYLDDDNWQGLPSVIDIDARYSFPKSVTDELSLNILEVNLGDGLSLSDPRHYESTLLGV